MMTSRQLDVWPLVAEGLTNKQIGERLGIKEKTIKAHVTAIMKELKVTTRTRAAALFHRPELRAPHNCTCDFACTGQHKLECACAPIAQVPMPTAQNWP